MSSRLLGVCAVACAFLACSSLKRAGDPVDAGPDGSDGGAGDGSDVDGSVADGALPDGATSDAGAPPLDFECTGDAWTKASKAKKECEPRQVKVVETPSPIDVRSVSIARTPAGRVGIVYNAEQDADTGELHLVHFIPATPTYPAPKLITRATGFAFHDGYLTKIAASAPDTLSVLSFDTGGTDGELHLRKLVAGTEPLTDNLIATGVGTPPEIALGSDLTGATYVAYRVATGATSAKLSTKKGTPAGVFTALPDLTTTLRPSDAPGIGSASFFLDPGGQVHLLYHYNSDVIAPQHSNPRYHTLAGAIWSDWKTVDNGVIDGLSGYSPTIAVFGTKKYAAFFFRKAAQSNPVTADLRLVSWDALLDVPTIEILDQQIPSGDTTVPAGALNPAYRVALAVDKFGLLHLAILRPTGPNAGYLEYRRQTPIAGGGTKWLSDIVDPDVMSDLSSAFVDMVVDENARPHIAYRSAKDGFVRYATRYDR